MTSTIMWTSTCSYSGVQVKIIIVQLEEYVVCYLVLQAQVILMQITTKKIYFFPEGNGTMG